jgi:predicted transposase YdaD
MRYDTTLKELFQTPPLRLLTLLANAPSVELLTVEYPAVKMRRPDLVYRLPDGAIHQFELQSENADTMDWRMLDYYSPLYRQFRREPVQYVLYVGHAPLRMKGALNHARLQFSYRVIDIREFDAGPLLVSELVADNLLALLCRNGAKRASVRKILRRIARLPEKERLDRITQLLILSNLRKLQVTVEEEVKKMPITVNLMEIEVFRNAFLDGAKQGKKEGKKLGEQQLLQRQLEHRFGKLPKWALAQLAAADVRLLETWSLKVLEAKSLNEVLPRQANGRQHKKR